MAIRVKEKLLKSGEYKVQLFGAGPAICLTVEETKKLICELRETLECIDDVVNPKSFHVPDACDVCGNLSVPCQYHDVGSLREQYAKELIERQCLQQ